MPSKFSRIAATLLLLAAAVGALAQGGGRGATYAFYGQQATQDRAVQQFERSDQERRHLHEAVPAETSGLSSNGEDSVADTSISQRRFGRLSPEERRMLRRQIDEAAQDIYAPRR